MDNVIPPIVLEGVETGKEVDWDTSHGEDDSMESVLFPDDQGAFQDTVREYVENEWGGWESHVHEKGEVVEPMAVKTEVSLHGENIQVSVYETDQSEQTEGFVHVNGVFVGEELLDNVVEWTAVWLPVSQINLYFEFILEILGEDFTNLGKRQ